MGRPRWGGAGRVGRLVADTVGVEPDFDLFDDLLNATEPRPIVRPVVRPASETEADGTGPHGVDATPDTAPAPASGPAAGAEPDRSAAPDGGVGRADPGATPDDDASFPALMAFLDAPMDDVAERTALQSYLRRQPSSLEQESAPTPGAQTPKGGTGADDEWPWSVPSEPGGDDDHPAAAPAVHEAHDGGSGADDEQIILLPDTWPAPSVGEERPAWPPPSPGTAIAGIPPPSGVEMSGSLANEPAAAVDPAACGPESAGPVSRFASGLDDDLLPLRRR